MAVIGERAVWTRVEGVSESGIDLLAARFIDHRYAPHVHEEYSIGVCTEGVELIDYRGGVHVAGPGTVALLEPGEPHTGAAAGDAGWSYDVAYLPPEMFGSRPPRFPEAVVMDPQAAGQLQRAYRMLMRGDDRLAGEALLIQVLDTVVERHSGEVGRSDEGLGGRVVQQAMASLGDRMTAPPSLRELADEVGLSRYQLLRAFRDEVGMRPYAWLAQHRVQRARGLLGAGLPLAEVAARVGFADQPHLTRWFRRVLGVTPAAYRNSVQDSRRTDR